MKKAYRRTDGRTNAKGNNIRRPLFKGAFKKSVKLQVIHPCMLVRQHLRRAPTNRDSCKWA